MIAELKAENFELKQKEHEYNVIKSQIADLEHRFKLVQEEKARMDTDNKEQEELQFRKSEITQENLKRSSVALSGVEGEIRNQLAKLEAQKALIGDKDEEIIRLRKRLSDLANEAERIQRTKNSLELELKDAHDGHRSVERQVSGFIEESEQLKRAKAVEESRMREAEIEVEQLRRKLRDLQSMADMTEQDNFQKTRVLDEESKMQRYTQGEVTMLANKNRQLQDDNDRFLKRLSALEDELKFSNRRLDEMSLMIEDKEKEIKVLRSESNYADSKELAAREELRKLRQDNETYQILLDKYRNDAEFHKSIREREITEKFRLEEEKDKLAREAIIKQMEARSAREELEKYRGSHGQLLEERMASEQELEALKEHANLLEAQNKSVRRFNNNS